MKRYITLLLSVCMSACISISAEMPNMHTEDFADMHPELTNAITRAINTVVFNNVLIEGNTNLKKDVVVEGSITGTLIGGSCQNVTGPTSSTLNALARYADTSGSVLANSGVTTDNSGNISGIAALSAEIISTSTFNVTGGQLITQQANCNQAIQDFPFNTLLVFAAAANAGTSTLILRPSDSQSTNGFTISFPPTPSHGQLFTIINGTSDSINASGSGSFSLTAPGGATIVNPIPGLNTVGGSPDPAALYIYYAPDNTWYLAATPHRVVI